MGNSRVTFRSPSTDEFILGDGVPFLATAGLTLHRTGASDYEIKVNRDLHNSDSPDVLVGDIPVLFISPRGETISNLQLDPPLPFSRALVSRMRADVDRQLGSIVGHDALGDHGELTSSGAQTANQLHVTVLAKALRLCSSMLRDWPTKSAPEVQWRRTGIPGGREDFKMTMRDPKKSRFYTSKSGNLYPERTARTISGAEPWTSKLLSAAATELYWRTRNRLHHDEEETVSNPLTEILSTISQHAKPKNREPSTPLATWPPIAVQVYIALRQAIAVLTPDRTGRENYLPATLLWRLYEHWIGGHLLPSGGAVKLKRHQPAAGLEWSARWEEDGIQRVLLAQPRIGAQLDDFDGALFAPVRSITSLLIPDYFLQSKVGDEITTVAIDCKRRLPTGLGARDIAESGSKYVWGILVSQENHEQKLHQSCILTSSSNPPLMNDDTSLISALFAMPPGEPSNWRDAVLCTQR